MALCHSSIIVFHLDLISSPYLSSRILQCMFMPPSTPIGLAGHEVAVVGGEKDHCADQVCGILIALKSAALSAVGELLGAGHAFLIGAGDSQAGHDRVHADIVVADFPASARVKPRTPALEDT